MKVTIVEFDGSGGLIHFAYQLCSAIADLGVETTLITCSDYELADFPHNFEVKKILNLWQTERIQRLIREDLRDLSRIQELSQIEMLVALLPERASGVLSINSLRKDLEVA